MLLDYMLLVSVTTNFFRWAWEGHIDAQTAAELIGGTAVGVGILRIIGSSAFQEKAQIWKAIGTAVGFGFNVAQGNPQLALWLTALMFAMAGVPFGLYVMMAGAFKSKQTHDGTSNREGSRIPSIGTIIFLIILGLACMEVIPKWLAGQLQ